MVIAARTIVAIILSTLASAAPISDAFAQSMTDWPEFQAAMAAPDDVDLVYAFVNKAIEADRLSEAATMMERLLRFRPERDDIRLDLIKLYRAQGAEGSAAAEEALLSPDILAADEAERGRVRVTGVFGFGAGYDTNPGADPGTDTITLAGITFDSQSDLGVDRRESPLLFYQAALEFDAPATDDRPRLIVDFSSFGIMFPDDTEQDDLFLTSSAGPSFALGGVTIRPFGSVEARYFDSDPYSLAGFGGLQVMQSLSQTSFLRIDAAFGYRAHFETPESPDRDEMNGREARIGARWGGVAAPELYGEVGMSLTRLDARADFESFTALGVDGLLSRNVRFGGYDASLSLGGGALVTLYDQSDPNLLEPFAREELALFGFAGVALALDEATTLDATVAYRRRFANVDLFDSDGFRGTLRLSRRF